jgi:Uma2 family endonuclease
MAADIGEGTFELVRGEVTKQPPAMPEHGVICSNVTAILWNYGRESGHGYPLSNDSAVLTECGPDTVRGPDVCFYSHVRLPRSQVGDSLPAVPPDMAVEVDSPGNRPSEILKKISEYLGVGVPLVWVIHPRRRAVVLYRADEPAPFMLREGDVLENLPELPGFRCAVSDFFV